ncbi:GGDEF domain-containing protein [Clostridium sp. CTA-19]
MNDKSVNLDIYFTIFIVEIFIIFSFLYFYMDRNSVIDFIMLGAMSLIIIISYLKGTIWGMLSSAFVIFIYATYFIYTNITLSKTIELNVYLWLFFIPIISFTIGKISYNINELQGLEKELKEEVDELITIDKETGLGNSRGFYNDLEREIIRSKKYNRPFVLMIIKITYYDELLSYFGKEKIKKLFNMISKSIVKSARIEDTKYMLNENTFAVLLIETNLKESNVISEKIRKNIENLDLKSKNKDKNINLEMKISTVEYKNDIKNAFEFKEMADKELEYDV